MKLRAWALTGSSTLQPLLQSQEADDEQREEHLDLEDEAQHGAELVEAADDEENPKRRGDVAPRDAVARGALQLLRRAVHLVEALLALLDGVDHQLLSERGAPRRQAGHAGAELAVQHVVRLELRVVELGHLERGRLAVVEHRDDVQRVLLALRVGLLQLLLAHRLPRAGQHLALEVLVLEKLLEAVHNDRGDAVLDALQVLLGALEEHNKDEVLELVGDGRRNEALVARAEGLERRLVGAVDELVDGAPVLLAGELLLQKQLVYDLEALVDLGADLAAERVDVARPRHVNLVPEGHVENVGGGAAVEGGLRPDSAVVLVAHRARCHRGRERVPQLRPYLLADGAELGPDLEGLAAAHHQGDATLVNGEPLAHLHGRLHCQFGALLRDYHVEDRLELLEKGVDELAPDLDAGFLVIPRGGLEVVLHHRGAKRRTTRFEIVQATGLRVGNHLGHLRRGRLKHGALDFLAPEVGQHFALGGDVEVVLLLHSVQDVLALGQLEVGLHHRLEQPIVGARQVAQGVVPQVDDDAVRYRQAEQRRPVLEGQPALSALPRVGPLDVDHQRGVPLLGALGHHERAPEALGGLAVAQLRVHHVEVQAEDGVEQGAWEGLGHIQKVRGLVVVLGRGQLRDQGARQRAGELHARAPARSGVVARNGRPGTGSPLEHRGGVAAALVDGTTRLALRRNLLRHVLQECLLLLHLVGAEVRRLRLVVRRAPPAVHELLSGVHEAAVRQTRSRLHHVLLTHRLVVVEGVHRVVALREVSLRVVLRRLEEGRVGDKHLLGPAVHVHLGALRLPGPAVPGGGALLRRHVPQHDGGAGGARGERLVLLLLQQHLTQVRGHHAAAVDHGAAHPPELLLLLHGAHAALVVHLHPRLRQSQKGIHARRQGAVGVLAVGAARALGKQPAAPGRQEEVVEGSQPRGVDRRLALLLQPGQPGAAQVLAAPLHARHEFPHRDPAALRGAVPQQGRHQAVGEDSVADDLLAAVGGDGRDGRADERERPEHRLDGDVLEGRRGDANAVGRGVARDGRHEPVHQRRRAVDLEGGQELGAHHLVVHGEVAPDLGVVLGLVQLAGGVREGPNAAEHGALDVAPGTQAAGGVQRGLHPHRVHHDRHLAALVGRLDQLAHLPRRDHAVRRVAEAHVVARHQRLVVALPLPAAHVVGLHGVAGEVEDAAVSGARAAHEPPQGLENVAARRALLFGHRHAGGAERKCLRQVQVLVGNRALEHITNQSA
ncbi:microtubule-associated protein futsch [Babesia caballi]|uniref:Microtubule-associated protein futsch n=1 Tax=Babesia caballi TaxID=5871 RepID=A0AAV4LYJ6_BABCB|nr:microtubule-associated protein futsch [Babesia caballi]